ncbi:MAG: tetratricopeptide repeat protein [Candidatus Obscuribacterales bacterium]|nr:tetratricopeptide repeat protein [Candidatus Obscuribacterales bacterium]
MTGLNQQVADLIDKGLYSEAEEVFLSALRDPGKRGECELPSIEQSLACLYVAQGDYDRAEATYRTAYERMLQSGDNDPALAVLLGNFATFYMMTDRLSLAEDFLIESVSILGANEDLTDELSACLSSLAECYRRSGKLSEAEDILKRSVELAEAGGCPNNMAICMNNMAHFFITTGRFAEAEPFLNKALERMDVGHLDYPSVLNNLAFVFHWKRDYLAAAALLSRALRLLQISGRTSLPIVATIVSNIIKSLASGVQCSNVEHLYRQALTVMHESVGLEHPDSAILLSNLAHVHIRRNNLTAAQDLLTWAGDILADLGCVDDKVAYAILGMANTCAARQQFTEAELLFKAVLRAFERMHAETQIGYLFCLSQLTILYHQWNRPAQRDEVLDTALNLLGSRSATSSDFDNLEVIGILADLSFTCEQYEQAQALYKRADAAMSMNDVNIVPIAL